MSAYADAPASGGAALTGRALVPVFGALMLGMFLAALDPDDRVDRAADDRGQPGRARPPLLGRHVLPARVDGLDAAVRALPPQVASRFGGGVQISPEEVHGLAPTVRHDFLLAFVDSLQPVFLVGAALTAPAFLLAWLLDEVPLRSTAPADASEAPRPAAATRPAQSRSAGS